MTGVIKTIVGGGRPTFKAGGNALESVLEGASGVTVDAVGNRYVAGFLAHHVFKIDPAGTVTVFAGTGSPTTSGDGGPANAAAINGPSAVAVDGEVVYIVEQLGNRVRRVDEKGVITTVAGGGKRETAGKENVAAAETFLEVPNGIALRNGELLVTEFGGNRVRRIDRNGVITTLAGTGEAGSGGDGGRGKLASVHGPTGIAVDPKGVVYVAEMFGGRVRRIDAAGNISTFAGSGPRGQSFEGKRATEAKLRAPNGLALDNQGNLFVADFADNHIYTINTQNSIIKTLAGTRKAGTVGTIGMARSGPARQVPIESPLGLAVDRAGNLLVALYNQGAVLSVDSQGAGLAADATSAVVRHVAGEFSPPLTEGARPTDLYLKNAGSVATDAYGNIYIADVFANRVIKVAADESRVATLVGPTSSGAGLTNDILDVHHPVGVVPIANGLVVIEANSHRVRFISNVALARRDTTNPGGDARTIRQVAGTRSASVLLQESYYMDQEADHAHYGEAYSSYAYAPPSEATASADGAKDQQPKLVNVAGSKPAAAGAKREIAPFFVYTDTGNNRVRMIDERGVATTVAGNGKTVSSGDGKQAIKAGIPHPQDVTVDADGNLYISEAHRVRRVDIRTGVITTIAGNGKKGFSGFGGPATKASITSAYGLALDGKDLYIADPWAGVVYKVDERGIISVFAGNGEHNSLGDGGPAHKAGLNTPIDLAIRRAADGGVHLLIAELEGGRVRSVQLR